MVWEETIILLPDKVAMFTDSERKYSLRKVRFVFLSATIPNAKEFAGWIAKLHKQVQYFSFIFLYFLVAC